MTHAVAYIRVSTSEQADSGLGIAAQEATLKAEAERRGWTLELVTEVISGGKASYKRPLLAEAMAALDAGRAQVLLVARLDRASRSVVDLMGVLDRAERRGWSFLSCDLGVDTSTPAGRAVVGVLGVAAQLERDLIRTRTREAMQAKKRRGERLGRPVVLSAECRRRVDELHSGGLSLRAIAAIMTSESWPTARGGYTWTHTSVAAVLRSLACDAEHAAIVAALAA